MLGEQVDESFLPARRLDSSCFQSADCKRKGEADGVSVTCAVLLGGNEARKALVLFEEGADGCADHAWSHHYDVGGRGDGEFGVEVVEAGCDDNADIWFEFGSELVVEQGGLELIWDEEKEDVGLGGGGDEVGGEVDAVFLGLFAVVVFERGGYDLGWGFE